MDSSGVSNPPSCLSNPEDLNPLTFRSDRVQPVVRCMEIMDSIDSLTPVFGDCIDFIEPYIGGRHNGLACDNTYTEEVASSSLVPPTKIPPLRNEP